MQIDGQKHCVKHKRHKYQFVHKRNLLLRPVQFAVYISHPQHHDQKNQPFPHCSADDCRSVKRRSTLFVRHMKDKVKQTGSRDTQAEIIKDAQGQALSLPELI